MMFSLKHCEYCGIALGKKLGFLSQPGFMYGDGRLICQTCHENAIKTDAHLYEVWTYTKKCFDHLGLKVDWPGVVIELLNKPALQSAFSGSNVVGCASFVIYPTKVDAKVSILYGLPKLMALETLAHEIGHVWCKQHRVMFKPDSDHEEGFCNVLSCLVLQSLPQDSDVRHRIKSLFKNPDPVYGEHFRTHWKSLEALAWPLYKEKIITSKFVQQ